MSIRLMNRVYEKAVDATTQRVLLVLCDYANDHGQCWPSIPLMAWKLGVSERTIMRNVARLEETGVIAVHRQVGAVNRYEINLEVLPNKPEPPTKRHPRQPATRDIAVSPPPLTNCPPTRDIAVSPEPPVEPSKEPPIDLSAKSQSESDRRFDLFWAAYPRKQAKGDARRAWAKLRPSADLTDRMIEAINAQKLSPRWQEEGGKYIPHPATWLNGERWEDEGITVHKVRRFVT